MGGGKAIAETRHPGTGPGRVRTLRARVAVGTVGLLAAATVGVPAPFSAAAGRPAPCRAHQLQLREGAGGAGLGHIGMPLRFRNRSRVSCTLHGYPVVAGLNRHGRQVEQARRTKSGYLGGVRPGHRIPTVTLRPGRVASALVEGTDVPAGHHTHCRELHGLLVTPPNQRRAVRLRHAPPDCSRIEVHPVVPGKTGTLGR